MVNTIMKIEGYWKSYNDIPSLVGYMSMALMVYKLSTNWVNRFFQYTNKMSYEWYLIHILILVFTSNLQEAYCLSMQIGLC